MNTQEIRNRKMEARKILIHLVTNGLILKYAKDISNFDGMLKILVCCIHMIEGKYSPIEMGSELTDLFDDFLSTCTDKNNSITRMDSMIISLVTSCCAVMFQNKDIEKHSEHMSVSVVAVKGVIQLLEKEIVRKDKLEEFRAYSLNKAKEMDEETSNVIFF